MENVNYQRKHTIGNVRPVTANWPNRGRSRDWLAYSPYTKLNDQSVGKSKLSNKWSKNTIIKMMVDHSLIYIYSPLRHCKSTIIDTINLLWWNCAMFAIFFSLSLHAYSSFLVLPEHYSLSKLTCTYHTYIVVCSV